jgi:GTP-binding protein
VERTRVLAFLVPLDQENPQAVYDRLRQEVRQYSEELAHKTHVVVLTKLDLRKSQELVPELTTEGAAGVLAISSATGQGVEDLKNYLWQLVQQAKAAEPAEQGGPWQDEDVLR